ncbi:MAG: hypothetical protein AAFZ15_03365 [Bacteroidota bacterium]
MLDKILLVSGLVGFLFSSSFSQPQISVDTSFYSNYSTPYIDYPLHRYATDNAVESKIKTICQAAGIEINFEMVSTDVKSVAVVKTPEKNYLLYSSFFFWANQDNASNQYLVLAHAIGLLKEPYTLNAKKRIFEEISADEIAGRLLYQIQNAARGLTKESFLNSLQRLPYGYTNVPLAKRIEAFERGWAFSDGLLNAKKSAGFYSDKSKIDELPLPRYWLEGFPSTYRDNGHHLKKTFTSQKTATMRDVDELIQRALINAGFQQWGYYMVNNGFAVITQVEQFDKDHEEALSLSEQYRWRDVPPEENISNILSFFKGYLWPRNGYFRFFVFVVSDRPVPKKKSDINISPPYVENLMKTGFTSLTKEVAGIPFTESHHVTILVYEMEVLESTRLGNENTPPMFQPGTHLKGAGILQQIGR